jgi:eukaryotic-like serine/threonine-protein kinase
MHTLRDETTCPSPRDGHGVAEGEDHAVAALHIVGRYVMYGEIASGGMATVHFGRLIGPSGFARPVAIKRLRPQYAVDPDFVRMFFDEACLAARVVHPNVVPTLDVVDVDGEVFLVMEYVCGPTLSQFVRAAGRRGMPIPPMISAGIVSGILRGLHAAHEVTNDLGESLQLVHRDVSPQNVLVGADGVPRLLDFGIAKASGRLQNTRQGTVKGKLAYMAPEQLRNEAIGPRTDLYAAAVILWELLTGRRLFSMPDEHATIAKILGEPVTRPSSIVPGLLASLDGVVVRGLQRDPANRFTSALEMAAELDACLGVPSTGEMADWVEEISGSELRERASLIAAISRSAAQGSDPPPGEDASTGEVSTVVARERVSHIAAIERAAANERVAAIDRVSAGHGGPLSDRDVSSRNSSARPDCYVWEPSTQGAVKVDDHDDARVSPFDREPLSRVRMWSVAGSISIVLLGAAMSVVLTGRPKSAIAVRKSAYEAIAAPLVSPMDASSPSPTASSPRSVATSVSSVSAPAASMQSPIDVERLPVAISVALESTSVSKSKRKLVTPATADARLGTNTSNHPDSQDCARPVMTDAKGHVHFKLSCL